MTSNPGRSKSVSPNSTRVMVLSTLGVLNVAIAMRVLVVDSLPPGSSCALHSILGVERTWFTFSAALMLVLFFVSYASIGVVDYALSKKASSSMSTIPLLAGGAAGIVLQGIVFLTDRAAIVPSAWLNHGLNYKDEGLLTIALSLAVWAVWSKSRSLLIVAGVYSLLMLLDFSALSDSRWLLYVVPALALFVSALLFSGASQNLVPRQASPGAA